MNPRLLLCLALVLGCILFVGSISAPGADLQLRVSSDFSGGSARILKLDLASNMVGITPAGDPKRGLPCWWYSRLDNLDTCRLLVLEIVRSGSQK